MMSWWCVQQRTSADCQNPGVCVRVCLRSPFLPFWSPQRAPLCYRLRSWPDCNVPEDPYWKEYLVLSCWVLSLNWIKYKVLHFVWVMVSLFFLQPQLAISVLFLIQSYPCWPDLFCFSILFLSHSRSSTHSPCSRFHYCSVYWHIFCLFQAWLL